MLEASIHLTWLENLNFFDKSQKQPDSVPCWRGGGREGEGWGWSTVEYRNDWVDVEPAITQLSAVCPAGWRWGLVIVQEEGRNILEQYVTLVDVM